MNNRHSDRYSCVICGREADGLYVFTRELRAKLCFDSNARVLCWDCVESRLGRPVQVKDLKPDAICNQRYIKLLKQLENKTTPKEDIISCET